MPPTPALRAAPALLLLALLAGCGDGTQTGPPDAGSTLPPIDAAVLSRAEEGYRAFVQDESARLLERTREFAALVTAGRDAEARALYPRARQHWERIEPVAESFGDLDPRMDAREADVDTADGERWTGWHVLEKDLWPARAAGYSPLTGAQRAEVAGDLVAATEELDARIRATGDDALDYRIDDIADGARGLLEEVASGKVTGEEEYWSRTDLWDFQANVDGARTAFEGVRPALETRDPELAATLVSRFDALQALLDRHRAGDGFVGYDTLDPEQVRVLAAGVAALSEPLSRLSAAVTP